MTMEQLQQFMVVAKLSSFTRAAEALYVSHSTISRNISMLEQSLGVSLITRDTRSVTLTYAGKLLYMRGNDLIRHMESLVHEVQLAGKGATGILEIACINYYNEPLFATCRAMTEENPDINLSINQYNLEHIMQEILYDHVDIGVTFSYALGGQRDHFEVIPIAKERFCILAADSCDDQKLRNYVKTGHIDMPIIRINDLSYDFVDHLMDSRYVGQESDRESIQPATSLESMTLQIRAGIGVALLPESTARQYSNGCKIIELSDVDTSFEVVMVYKRTNKNPVIPMFIERYREIKKQYV